MRWRRLGTLPAAAATALLVAACGLLPTPTPTAIGGVPLVCVPAEWETPPADALGCGEAALVATGALPPGLPSLAGMRFEHGPRCQPDVAEEYISGLPPDQQAEARERNEAPCPPLEPARGVVVFTFAPVDGRTVPDSYVEVERTKAGAVRVVSDLLPLCAPPLVCE